MSSAIVRKLYRDVRRNAPWIAPDRQASSCLEAARTLREWDALESMGLVRLQAEPDDDYRPDCDCGDPRCPYRPFERGQSETNRLRRDIEAFGSVGEFCLPFVDDDGYWQPSEDWQHGGSVWGHVGYRNVLDWRENCYIIDIMRETIDAFRDAWKIHVRRRMTNPLSA